MPFHFKNNRYLIFSFLFFIIFNPPGYSQNIKKFDSLLINLKKATNDTTRIILYLDIGNIFELTNTDSSLLWYNKASNLSATGLNNNPNQQKTFKTLFAHSIKCIGVIKYYQGKYDETLEYYNKALDLYTELNLLEDISICYSNIGVVHQEQSRYDEAVTCYLKALKYFEKIGKQKLISTCYLNIGNVFSVQQNYKKAQEYYNKSLQTFSNLNDEYGMATCLENLGSLCCETYDFKGALTYYKKALEIK
ncbi:MAG: tetratricopeptide repeat protein [Bacteroidia bacterium]|nr:tetratricopeptide repeat protein [Bacteroidia bacterium]